MDSVFNGMKPQDVSATNRDNETKFYVVNDAASNQTYEYSPTGSLNESYPLDIANVAPRGIASNSQGTTVWTVDANRTVYVYDTIGARLGSWSASGLVNGAQIEGISTNGNDVWLVDAKADKVYRYAGAATRREGTQTPTSSFPLNSGNKNPKDLVTDGTSIWVVNDSTTDKVFKYRISDSKLLGSWTVTTSGASAPTGVTIDPNDVRHLWIVDSGTDRVYQYNDSTVLTSGSQSAAAVFALAAGNTNPRGIADPPSPGSMLAEATSVVSARTAPSSTLVPLSVARMSSSSVKKVTSEISVSEILVCSEFAETRNSSDRKSSGTELGLSRKPAAKRLNGMPGGVDQNVSSDITAGTDLDDLFADWSTDPMQLLLTGAY